MSTATCNSSFTCIKYLLAIQLPVPMASNWPLLVCLNRMQNNFFSGPAVINSPSVTFFFLYLGHFGTLALFWTITSPAPNCGKGSLGGWKAFLKDHRENWMVMGAAAQPGSSPAAVSLLTWTIWKESAKMALGQGRAAHGSAIYVMKTSDKWSEIARNDPLGASPQENT